MRAIVKFIDGGYVNIPADKIQKKEDWITILDGYGCELNSDYFRDGVAYCREADAQRDVPTLFDLVGCG